MSQFFLDGAEKEVYGPIRKGDPMEREYDAAVGRTTTALRVCDTCAAFLGMAEWPYEGAEFVVTHGRCTRCLEAGRVLEEKRNERDLELGRLP